MTSIYRSPAGERLVRERYRQALAAWPVPGEHRRVPTRQGETFVLVSGEPGAPPLVLLHGGHANSAMWMGDVACWAQAFRVYAVDLIGEPGYSAPSRPPLDSDAHALWLDDVLAALGVGSCQLIGISLGGWVALDYATRRPERVSALTVLCPAGVGRQKFAILFKVLLLGLLGARGRRMAVALVLGTEPGGAPEPGSAGSEVMELMALINRHFRGRVVRFPLFSDAALRRLTMPCLAIVGGRDVLFDSAAVRRRLEANLPRVTVRYLPEMGHLLTGQTEVIHAFLLAARGEQA